MDPFDPIRQQGPITSWQRAAISRALQGEGYRCQWSQSRGKTIVRAVGDDDFTGLYRAMALIEDVCPRALIEPNTGLANGIEGHRKWQAVIWVDPPLSEYLRRDAAGARELG